MSRFRKTKTIWQLLALLGIGMSIVFSLLIFFTKNLGSSIISPLADEIHTKGKKTESAKITATQKNPQELISQIKKLTEKQTGIFSVYIFDLNENKGFGFNESTIYTAASVNKLPVLASLYYLVGQGKMDLDQRITIQANDIQDYGTGVIRYQGAGSVYSLKSLAQLMIEKSDNTAAYVLTSSIGQKTIQNLVNQWGLTQTDIVNNKTSNADMSLLLKKMYTDEIANKALTLEMIGFMDDSDFENRLPALLPDTVKIYHKIGTEVGNIHDVGVVNLPNHPYYIGVFSNDITDEQATEAIIAQISKLAFDFMNQ